MFKLEATGCLGRDAEIREVNNTKKIAYNVAVLLRQKSTQGDFKESTQWVSCLQPYHEGSTLVSRLTEGTRVFIRGGLRLGTYKDKCGNIRVGVSCDIDQLEIQPRGEVNSDTDDYTANGLKY